MKLSKLFHKHKYDIWGSKEIKVGLTHGRHTSFIVMECRCKDKLAFPSDNFNIALNEGTEETKEFLKSLGAHI